MFSTHASRACAIFSARMAFSGGTLSVRLSRCVLHSQHVRTVSLSTCVVPRRFLATPSSASSAAASERISSSSPRSFAEFGLSASLMSALARGGITAPTEIQSQVARLHTFTRAD